MVRQKVIVVIAASNFFICLFSLIKQCKSNGKKAESEENEQEVLHCALSLDMSSCGQGT
jgi:hypothetical protein